MDAATSPRPARAAMAAAVLCVAALALVGWPALSRADGRQPPARLRDTGLYASWAERRIKSDNLAFSPQYPLWSDGAAKRRWVHIPRGTWVDASQPDRWKFPPGTRFWKEFSFGRPIETRYLERLRDGTWRYASYVWTEDGQDALLAPELGLAAAHELRPGLSHSIPGVADCRACHEGRPTPVLGFDALQLSPDRDPNAPHAEAISGGIDLPALVARGLVRGLPARLLQEPPRIAAPSAGARAALGYLHANCGGCHNDAGPLAPLGLTLAQLLQLPPGAPLPALRTTVGQPVRGHLPGAPDGGTKRIVPGHPEASALLVRMRSRHPLLQMPPLGTKLVDPQAVALIERWIAEDLGPPDPSIATRPTNHEEKTP
jgi:hypothetical protein